MRIELTAQQVVGSLLEQGNDRPTITSPVTARVSSFWTMPAGAASGAATDRAMLARRARVAVVNFMIAG